MILIKKNGKQDKSVLKEKSLKDTKEHKIKDKTMTKKEKEKKSIKYPFDIARIYIQQIRTCIDTDITHLLM